MKGTNLGKETIDWLYHEQLKVDREWSVRTENGFRWWAYRNAQTIEVIGEETGPEGEPGYLISVRTELLRDLDLNEKSLQAINDVLMSLASMSGPVYDAESRTLSLCSLVRVHSEISAWMRALISVSATMQIHEAQIMGDVLAPKLNAKKHVSGHPENGMRPKPDEMAYVVERLVEPIGRMPCKWQQGEFQDVVERCMQERPASGARAEHAQFSVSFPYGEGWSYCTVGYNIHLRYGNGLSLVQSFPAEKSSEAEGVALALELNSNELLKKTTGYGFGSYGYEKQCVVYTCFLPNVVYKPGFLPNLYFAAGMRARETARLLTGKDWT